MHSELPGLAMNSHLGSIGSSAAVLAAAPMMSAANVIATTADTRSLTFRITSPSP